MKAEEVEAQVRKELKNDQLSGRAWRLENAVNEHLLARRVYEALCTPPEGFYYDTPAAKRMQRSVRHVLERLAALGELVEEHAHAGASSACGARAARRDGARPMTSTRRAISSRPGPGGTRRLPTASCWTARNFLATEATIRR